ncbi:unnamed protein product [Darwinula stevensoni]|uniref:Uncharacterized protein n=1 Tax=Darwinula stevensoni TaxID=69355 RepID=A0A7R8X847_9CRUS|nr:unnamed protein product [Darwinula stevensoni]CAG0884039.1 unnamed protein product [Darwinula stevensoni]
MQVLRAFPAMQEHVRLFQDLLQDESLDFWRSPTELMEPVDIMAPPDKATELKKTLSDALWLDVIPTLEVYDRSSLPAILMAGREDWMEEGTKEDGRELNPGLLIAGQDVPWTTVLEDVGEAVMSSISSAHHPGVHVKRPTRFSPEYLRLDAIHNQLRSLAKEHSALATVSSIGKSSEGRDLLLLTIRHPSKTQKPAIWIDGGRPVEFDDDLLIATLEDYPAATVEELAQKLNSTHFSVHCRWETTAGKSVKTWKVGSTCVVTRQS